jgi:hypothetical protein
MVRRKAMGGRTKVRRTPVPRRRRAGAPLSFSSMLSMLGGASQRLQSARPRQRRV